MARKRITQIFPRLLPIRQRQRAFCFYLKMRLDRSRYAGEQRRDRLPVKIFEIGVPMYNRETGFDMIYQENKVFNLKLAAAMLDGLIIDPGETFSFWNRVRRADEQVAYRDGLVDVNGELTVRYGGGLCQISNLLCRLFLHTPLTIIERHGHDKKDFPQPAGDTLKGADATVAEGWLDLKVRNDTDNTFQLSLAFDEEHIIGRIYARKDMGRTWKAVNKGLSYFREAEGIFEEVDVLRRVWDISQNRCISETTIYKNRCRIGYPLPVGTQVIERR